MDAWAEGPATASLLSCWCIAWLATGPAGSSSNNGQLPDCCQCMSAGLREQANKGCRGKALPYHSYIWKPFCVCLLYFCPAIGMISNSSLEVLSYLFLQLSWSLLLQANLHHCSMGLGKVRIPSELNSRDEEDCQRCYLISNLLHALSSAFDVGNQEKVLPRLRDLVSLPSRSSVASSSPINCGQSFCLNTICFSCNLHKCPKGLCSWFSSNLPFVC